MNANTFGIFENDSRQERRATEIIKYVTIKHVFLFIAARKSSFQAILFLLL